MKDATSSVRIVLLSGVLTSLALIGCPKYVPPTTQVVCTRPLINEKRVLMTVAPTVVGGERSDRFAGAVETAVQTWLRGRGARTTETSPYDFHIFGTVSESGDALLGVATVTLKMITVESEVVANGAGTAVYSGSVRDGSRSDTEAVGRAARLAAENLCMTREREYLYTAPRAPQEAPPADPYAEGYAYGYMGVYPVLGYHHRHGGHARGGAISLSLPLPLHIQIYKAIKGNSDGGRSRHDGRHHRGRNRSGGHPRR